MTAMKTRHKFENNRHIYSSKQVWNKYGYVELEAELWTVNKNGNISEKRHSKQYAHSKTALITNASFKRLYKNCIVICANAHNKKFRNASETSYTYNVIWYRIVYSSRNPVKTKFIKSRQSIKVTEKYKNGRKNIKYIKQEKNKDINARKSIDKKEKERIKELIKGQKEMLTAKEYARLKRYSKRMKKEKYIKVKQQKNKRRKLSQPKKHKRQ